MQPTTNIRKVNPSAITKNILPSNRINAFVGNIITTWTYNGVDITYNKSGFTYDGFSASTNLTKPIVRIAL